jgi:hypothetical protein
VASRSVVVVATWNVRSVLLSVGMVSGLVVRGHRTGETLRRCVGGRFTCLAPAFGRDLAPPTAAKLGLLWIAHASAIPTNGGAEPPATGQPASERIDPRGGLATAKRLDTLFGAAWSEPAPS